jgi:serine/threonine protein phosphatase 1
MASLPYLIEIETEHGLVGIVHADSPVSDWNRLVADIERERADGKTRRKAIWSRTRWKAHQPHPSPSRNTLRSLLDKARHSVRGETHVVGRIENVTAVIVGHTPVSAVTAKDNVINIDTGAVYGGKLTIMDLADLPKWIDVSPRSSVADEPGWREPVMANSAVSAQAPAVKVGIASADVAASEHDVALAEHPAPSDIPSATAARRDDLQNEAPRLAPESRPAPEPLTSFVSNGMHITVRMSMHSMVSELQQGANTVATRRR